MAHLPAPRLLPVTIAAMAVLLAVKSVGMLGAAFTDGQHPQTAMVAAANAASTEKEHTAPPAAQSPPLAPPPSAPPAADAPHGSTAAHASITPPGASPSGASPSGASPSGASPSGASPSGASTSEATPSPGPAPVSESEKTILQELRQRRKDIDSRESTVAARESVLTAAEAKLAVRVTQMQALQQKLEGLDAAQLAKEDAGWLALVKLYEAMKPKEAAAIFNDLSMPVVLQLINHMKDSKAAAVMAAMTPERARDVTSDLALMRTGHDNASAPGSASKTNQLGG